MLSALAATKENSKNQKENVEVRFSETRKYIQWHLCFQEISIAIQKNNNIQSFACVVALLNFSVFQLTNKEKNFLWIFLFCRTRKKFFPRQSRDWIANSRLFFFMQNRISYFFRRMKTKFSME